MKKGLFELTLAVLLLCACSTQSPETEILLTTTEELSENDTTTEITPDRLVSSYHLIKEDATFESGEDILPEKEKAEQEESIQQEMVLLPPEMLSYLRFLRNEASVNLFVGTWIPRQM